ncbi:hypothetical protein DAI22_04g264100 [Oryza sativa Japonica Group]|jgi:hypothetical protein|nr:hypothetical protein DAI22_04g264100 [Oryza sativa Japonica Group]
MSIVCSVMIHSQGNLYSRVYDDPVEEEGTALDEAGNFNNDLENNIEELCRRLEGRCLQEKEQETLLLQ